MTAKTVKSMCPMNCHPTLCGMDVEIRADGSVNIEGDASNPDSQGFLCMRGNAAHEIIGNPARLLTPMCRAERATDRWTDATWDPLLDQIAQKMDEVGRESVGIWQGHGNAVNDYGVGLKRAQMERFANLYGCQYWNPAMICWGLGAFGLGLTGALETSTKEDMGRNSDMIVLWGANTVSQANTFKHVEAAKARGAKVVVIDVRRTEASALGDTVLLVRPGTDTALALAMMHVIIAQKLWDRDFVEQHSLGFSDLATHVAQFSPDWAAAQTGIAADQIITLAQAYAKSAAAMIIIGGSSLHKGENTWQAARAISCLPALGGHFGKPGGGIGPRHGARSHGAGFNDISAADRRLAGNYVPNQMEAIVEALEEGRIKVLLTIGSNILSSFPDTERLRRALSQAELIVAYDIFMSQSIREVADIVLPGTIWLEELGAKATNTHVYLADKALPQPAGVRPAYALYQGLAKRLNVADVYPWADQEAALDAVLDHPATGHASVAYLREHHGRAALNISHVAYPDLKFHTDSQKIEFQSQRAEAMGLPALPILPDPIENSFPLRFAHGRTFAHFHSFYDHGRALQTLAAREPNPELWMSPKDASARALVSGDPILMFNQRGSFEAVAKVMNRIPDGTVWMHDGWEGLNVLTDCTSVLPEKALTAFPFSVGQSSYFAAIEITKNPTP